MREAAVVLGAPPTMVRRSWCNPRASPGASSGGGRRGVAADPGFSSGAAPPGHAVAPKGVDLRCAVIVIALPRGPPGSALARAPGATRIARPPLSLPRLAAF